jgi:acetoin utilization deacetylase AcuC-like enzyme
VVSPGSWEAALRAVGGACAATDEVLEGRARNAFCALRPPGHHAERDRAMGFCLFNNIAIAAARARDVHGLDRVAVVDFDVHHGNGTQHLFEADGGFFYASSHEHPLFPGTGMASETGVGNIVNVPLPPMSGPAAFRDAYDRHILPALAAFQPQLLLVSAGFDGHVRDPLASMQLTGADFGWVTERLLDAAERHCGGKLVSLLEGGYDLTGLAEGVSAHVAALMGHG